MAFRVDGLDGEWVLCRICCATVGVARVGAGFMICSKCDLPCPLFSEWGTIASKLQHDAQQACCDDVSACHVL